MAKEGKRGNEERKAGKLEVKEGKEGWGRRDGEGVKEQRKKQ